MAGIGFILRKLYRQDDLLSLARAYAHSAFASTGPWLFTVLALGLIVAIGKRDTGHDEMFLFRVILIYNFSFSLIMSGSVYMIVTRYLSDCIYARDVSSAPGMLYGALLLLWLAGVLVSGLFYGVYAQLGAVLTISATINYLLLCAIWLISIFISALRNYRQITNAFLLGMIVAVVGCKFFGAAMGTTGLLNGFSLGLAVIMAVLLGHVFTEYPYPIRRPFVFLSYFRRYWDLVLCGLIYNMAIWSDKWIMWFAPEATRTANGLVIYPIYDSSMFIAYLTTVPAMAFFLFHTETQFFERYRRYYHDIENKANFATISRNHKDIMHTVFGSAGSFLFLQGSLALLCTIAAPKIIDLLHGNYMQIGILRYGILGSLFQVLTLFLTILFSYFDNRRANLWIQSIFLLTNASFTWLSLYGGFPYYGIGYFFASFLTFTVAAVMMKSYLAQLPYHTFITTNTSVV